MDEEELGKLIYLGICNAWGWVPTQKGLDAFLRQRKAGWRDRTGRMIWPPKNERRKIWLSF